MKTFQDLNVLGLDEKARMQFIKDAVGEHKASKLYRDAKDAEAYYAKHNLTIEQFQKFLYTLSGQKVPDIFSPNYKLKTLFYRRFVIQQVQFVLSNGITFKSKQTAKNLGMDFTRKVIKLATRAMNGGVAFGFWNFDHLEVFSVADTVTMPGFVPIYDEEDGLLRAGIRFWTSPDGETDNYVLYESEGYTEYFQRKDEEMKAKSEARAPYIKRVSSTKASGVEKVEGSIYSGLPIIPMYANDIKESELNGIREAIDCYDLIKSGLANNIDEASEIYWVFRNVGGMDDPDLARLIERIKRTHAAALDSDEGVGAEAHTLNIPTEAREKMLDRIKRDLYEDFQIVNIAELSAAQKTATEIRAAYQPMVDKCSFFRDHISDFIEKLFKLIGIEDEPEYRFNQITNQLEETQMIMMASPALGEELTLKKMPFLSAEEIDSRIKELSAEDINRFNAPSEPEGEGQE